LAPALIISAYFIVGFAVYVLRSAVKGQYQDEEMRKRGSTALTGMYVRLCFVWLMQPIFKLVVKTGIPANAVTTLSVLLAAASGVAAAAGRFALAGWLYIFSGILDVFDGRLARLRGKAGKSGEALDSILDRYSDSAIMMGLAWYYRDSWVLVAVLFALVGSSIIPYIRAKGELVGVQMTMGMMQRAERIMYLGIAVALSPIVEAILVPNETRPIHRLAVMGIVLLAVSTQVTALQRLVHLMGALNESGRTAWRKRTIGQAWRNVVSGVVATAVDFGVVLAVVSVFLWSPVLGTALGCLVGGVVNFTMNRIWTFKSKGPKKQQMWRYTFVSLSSALLNSGGVAVMLLLPDIDYRIGWLVVRVAVYAAWNFPLHRDYVFVDDVAPQTFDKELSGVSRA
jgi:phosphatidylglycerophosphate synthase/putative flippase GtrA